MFPELSRRQTLLGDATANASMLICAVAIWLGFPNDLFHTPLLVLLWPVALANIGIGAPSPQKALIRGWIAATVGAAAALYWLCYPVHDVGGLPWSLAALCALLIACLLSGQSAIFAAASCYLRGFSAWRLAVSLAILWYLLDFTFAICLGFPWLEISGALSAWPILIQAADQVGAWVAGALWLCACLLCFLAVRPLLDGGIKIFRYKTFICGALLFFALYGYGYWRLHEPEANHGVIVNAMFVDGNIDQNQKWLPAFQRKSLDTYLELTREGLAQARVEGLERPLIIWPETALPFFYEESPSLASRVRQCARDAHCPLLFGAPGLERLPDAPEGVVFNRAFLLNPEGMEIGHYDKEHLVPFGEYLPEWLNFGFLKALLQGVGIYGQGVGTGPLVYESLALGMLICYEGIFPWLARERISDGANIFVDISNDGWFRESPAARQHLLLTLPRCVEQNRWLLRAANTGISAVADSHGTLLLEGPRFQAGWLLAKARVCQEKTNFHKIEPLLAPCALIIFLLLAATAGKGALASKLDTRK